MKYLVLLATTALLSGTQAFARAPPETLLLLREPALSRDRLAFGYAGDIWIAGRDGSRRSSGSPWEIENEGVPPDIEVDIPPKATQNGADPQLAKAVEVIVADLKKLTFRPVAIPVQRPLRGQE